MTNTQPNSSLTDYVHLLGRHASTAFKEMNTSTPPQRVEVLHQLAHQLEQSKADLLEENAKDTQLAQSKHLTPQLIDRLKLTEDRFAAMIDGIHQVARLPDPVGSIADLKPLPSGIRVGKMRVPLGVIVMIYESRPNVTIDASALNLRVGNAVILRGGSESFHTNMALYQCIKTAIANTGLPQGLVQLVEHTSRETVATLVQMNEYVDLIIPRGSRALIEKVLQQSRVNVLRHLDGNCHVFVDRNADLNMAEKIVFNAKTRRYGVCNALESLLVDQAIAHDFAATGIFDKLIKHGVTIHACDQSLPMLTGKLCTPATEEDWSTEYLGPAISLKLVNGINEAIVHINHYGSHHTDAIVTDSLGNAEAFLRGVDSSSVMVNASTAFADGFEYGLGAEIGISTDKFHARGPVGLEGLTCEKYLVMGQGETRP